MDRDRSISSKVDNMWVEVIAYCVIFDLILLLGWGL